MACTHCQYSSTSVDQTSDIPVTSAVFRQDTDESLDTAKDRSVDHDRSHKIVLSLLCRRSILELETFRQVEVKLPEGQDQSIVVNMTTYLNGCTLEFSLESIADGDIDLGAVELQRRQTQFRFGATSLTAPSASLSFQFPGKTRSKTFFS
jgi:hypothetical protein